MKKNYSRSSNAASFYKKAGWDVEKDPPADFHDQCVESISKYTGIPFGRPGVRTMYMSPDGEHRILGLVSQVYSDRLSGDYLLRRIEWATDCYLKEGVVPSRNKFLELGLSGRGAGKSNQVQKAIDTALDKLAK